MLKIVKSAQHRFPEELARLLDERTMSQRALERETGISQAHISRVLDGRMPASPQMINEVASALDLPGDYFIETQIATISERLAADAKLRRRVYRLAVKADAGR